MPLALSWEIGCNGNLERVAVSERANNPQDYLNVSLNSMKKDGDYGVTVVFITENHEDPNVIGLAIKKTGNGV